MTCSTIAWPRWAVLDTTDSLAQQDIRPQRPTARLNFTGGSGLNAPW